MNQVAPIRTAGVEGFTAGDFMRLVDGGVFRGSKVELVAGAIIKMAPSGNDHAHLNALIASMLIRASETLPVRIGTDLAVLIDELTIRGVDVAMYDAEAPSGSVEAGRVRLAVEVADSTLAKDLVVKAGEYASSGIANYWVVDVQAQVTHVMSDPVEGSYRERGVVRFGKPIPVPHADRTIVIGRPAPSSD